MMNEPFLIYKQNGFTFSFCGNHLLVYDDFHRIEYKIQLDHRPDFTFTIEKTRIDKLVEPRTAAGSLD